MQADWPSMYAWFLEIAFVQEVGMHVCLVSVFGIITAVLT